MFWLKNKKTRELLTLCKCGKRITAYTIFVKVVFLVPEFAVGSAQREAASWMPVLFPRPQCAKLFTETG